MGVPRRRGDDELNTTVRHRAIADRERRWFEPVLRWDLDNEEEEESDAEILTLPLPKGTSSRQREVLRDALDQLSEIDEASEEEGYPRPSDAAKASAERIARELVKLRSSRFEIYPDKRGEVAIFLKGREKGSLLILCDSKGGAACFVSVSGRNRRARYESASDLPDSFVREALSAVK